MKDLNDTKGGGSAQKLPRWTDEVKMLKFGSDHKQIRMLPGICADSIHWVPLITKDGKKTQFAVKCNGFNPDTEISDATKCWACTAGIKLQTHYYANVIDREEQEGGPGNRQTAFAEKDGEFLSMDSKLWSPVYVWRFPTSLAEKLRSFEKLNFVKNKAGEKIKHPVNHQKYGCDINVKFDSKAAAMNMWDVQMARDGVVALTNDELDYLTWDLDGMYADRFYTPQATLKKDLVRINFLTASGEPTGEEIGQSKPKGEDGGSKRDHASSIDLGEESYDDRPSSARSKPSRDNDGWDEENEPPRNSRHEELDDNAEAEVTPHRTGKGNPKSAGRGRTSDENF